VTARATIPAVGRKPSELDPAFRRDLRRVIRRRAEAEAGLKDVVLRGMADGQSVAAMAREFGEDGIDRRLLWAWIQAWTRDEEAGQ
jgi:hypothetical protein